MHWQPNVEINANAIDASNINTHIYYSIDDLTIWSDKRVQRERIRAFLSWTNIDSNFKWQYRKDIIAHHNEHAHQPKSIFPPPSFKWLFVVMFYYASKTNKKNRYSKFNPQKFAFWRYEIAANWNAARKTLSATTCQHIPVILFFYRVDAIL